jgi:hypothetical protein
MNKKPKIHFMLMSTVLCVIPVMLSAQQNNIEAMLRNCASIDDDGQRLSCYDKLLRPDKLTEITDLPPTTNVVTSSSVNAEEVEVTPSQVQGEVRETTPTQAQADVVKAEPIAVDEFGLKQKESRESVSITVTVNGIRKNLSDHFIYKTTDGQVWVQIDSRRPRYDEVPFIAEIRTASLGSFFLKPKSDGFSVRVRREK